MKEVCLLATLLLVAFDTQVSAGLWETEGQINARYGSCVTKIENAPKVSTVYVYKYANFYVLVIFADGKSQTEWYVHQDGRSGLSPGEIQQLLEMNSWGGIWRKNRELPVWTLDDSNAFAVYYADASLPGFGVCTREYRDRFNKGKIAGANPSNPDAMQRRIF